MTHTWKFCTQNTERLPQAGGQSDLYSKFMPAKATQDSLSKAITTGKRKKKKKKKRKTKKEKDKVGRSEQNWGNMGKKESVSYLFQISFCISLSDSRESEPIW